MNSTLIKIFGHFRNENLSTVYSFEATLSNHLKISKIWWCGERRLTWNGLIWSFVPVKAQTMRYILAVNFFHFFKHAVGLKKLIYLNKNSSTPAPKKRDLENSLQQSFTALSKLLVFRYLYPTSFWRKLLK